MHFALREILKKLAEIRAAKGVQYADAPVLRAWPFVLCIVQDEPEAQLLALLNACRFCMIAKADRGDLDPTMRVGRCYIDTGIKYC